MRSGKSILFVVAIVLVVLAQVYYLFTYYKEDKEMIEANKAEIESVKLRIQQLNERLARHEESKKELAKVQAERAALEGHLPDQGQRSRFESDLVDYLLAMDITDIYFTHSEKEMITSNIGNVNGISFELEFVGTYDDSRALVENLKKMFQTCNITSYTFDASVQKGDSEEAQKYRFHYGDAFSRIGKSVVKFDVYYKRTDEVNDEQYHSDVLGVVTDSPFRYVNRENVTLDANTTDESANENTSEDAQQDSALDLLNAKFMLNIGDAFTSGDGYKLSGPGSGVDTYVGLNSTKNVEITVSVYDDAYELLIKDSDGHEQSTRVDYEMSNPTMRIISTMRELQTVMPNVHVYIYNYTSEIMKVSLSGKMLDNIHIFNENNEEVFKGETKGRMSLT